MIFLFFQEKFFDFLAAFYYFQGQRQYLNFNLPNTKTISNQPIKELQ